MTDSEAIDIIRKALGEVAADRADDFANISLDVSIEDLDLDSVTTMEMVGVIEEELDIEFPDEELPKVNTLGDITKLMKGQTL